jgi:hypothetical protein
MKPRHYWALGTVVVAVGLAIFVLTTQRGEKVEETTLIPIQAGSLVRISVEWDESRDDEYAETDPMAETEDQTSDAPEVEAAPEDGTEEPTEPEQATDEGQPSDNAGDDAGGEDADDAEDAEPSRLTLVRQGSVDDIGGAHWVFDEPLEGLRADPSTMDNLVDRLSFLDCERVIEGDTPDLAKYGLDRPMLRLTVESDAGDSTTVLVGRKHPNADWERFAMVEGSGQAVVVASSLVTDLTRDPEELRDKRLFTLTTDDVTALEAVRSHDPAPSPEAPAEEPEEADPDEPEDPFEDPLEDEEMEVADETFTIRYEEPVMADEDPVWRVQGDESSFEGDASACRMLISDLTIKRVESFHIDHPDAEDIKACGLDQPSQTYSLTGRRTDAESGDRAREETTEALLLGDETAEGHYYAMASWRPEILVLRDTDFEALQKSLDDLRKKQLHDFDRDDIERIRTVRDGLAIELVPSEDDPDLWVLADGTDTQDFAASALVNMATILSAKEFVDDSPTSLEEYGLDSPAATMTITPKRGEPVTIYFGSEVAGDPASIYARSSLSDAVVTVDGFRLENIPDQLSDIAAVPQEEQERAPDGPATPGGMLDLEALGELSGPDESAEEGEANPEVPGGDGQS